MSLGNSISDQESMGRKYNFGFLMDRMPENKVKPHSGELQQKSKKSSMDLETFVGENEQKFRRAGGNM